VLQPAQQINTPFLTAPSGDCPNPTRHWVPLGKAAVHSLPAIGEGISPSAPGPIDQILGANPIVALNRMAKQAFPADSSRRTHSPGCQSYASIFFGSTGQKSQVAHFAQSLLNPSSSTFWDSGSNSPR
jgi:hypothetical protein